MYIQNLSESEKLLHEIDEIRIMNKTMRRKITEIQRKLIKQLDKSSSFMLMSDRNSESKVRCSVKELVNIQ